MKIHFLIKNPKIAVSVSPIISKKIQELGINIEERQKIGENNESIFNFHIKEIKLDQNSDLLESIKIFKLLFDGKTVKITSQNHRILLILDRYFEMASFVETLEEYDIFLQNIESDFIRSDELIFFDLF